MKVEVNETVTKRRKIEVYPCIKCDKMKNIEIYNCGYSSFNCAGGKCKRCGHTVPACQLGCEKFKFDWAWNKENDPSVIIERLNIERNKINNEIRLT